ncbi:MAG: YvrJ family protein [Fretibacterium sp.]|nr:YvrJ family protein [Fretibacterium sp.]
MENVFGGMIDKAFSVAVSAFLLLRMERELKLLRASIDRLRHCSVCAISPLNEDEETRRLWRAYAEEEAGQQ